jgi:hypothetical protein
VVYIFAENVSIAKHVLNHQLDKFGVTNFENMNGEFIVSVDPNRMKKSITMLISRKYSGGKYL